MSAANTAWGIKALLAGPHEPVGVVLAHLLAVVDLVAVTIHPGLAVIVDLDVAWTCQTSLCSEQLDSRFAGTHPRGSDRRRACCGPP